MVTLAVFPGMARASWVAKLANPGNLSGVIKLLVPQSGVVGLGAGEITRPALVEIDILAGLQLFRARRAVARIRQEIEPFLQDLAAAILARTERPLLDPLHGGEDLAPEILLVLQQGRIQLLEVNIRGHVPQMHGCIGQVSPALAAGRRTRLLLERGDVSAQASGEAFQLIPILIDLLLGHSPPQLTATGQFPMRNATAHPMPGLPWAGLS